MSVIINVNRRQQNTPSSKGKHVQKLLDQLDKALPKQHSIIYENPQKRITPIEASDILNNLVLGRISPFPPRGDTIKTYDVSEKLH